MAATPLLVDSTAYFRLAREVAPLLGVAFGDPPFSLCVIAGLDLEFGKSSRLKNKFHWVSRAEYETNRLNNRVGAKIKKFDADEARRQMNAHKLRRGLGVSKVDVDVLATAFILDVSIVTDDADLRSMAADFGIECRSSLEILGWFLDEDIITLTRAKAIVKVWRHDDDLPAVEAKFVNEFFEIFGETPWKK